MVVQIVMGSTSDMEVAEKAIKILKKFEISHEVNVASAHRSPEKVREIAKKDADIFIAIAGLSAALPGNIASLTNKPVIGVPVSGKVNLDAILSIIQMPPGVPVAAVGLDRGDNAALLAAQILALHDDKIKKRLRKYKEKMKEVKNVV